MAELVNTPMNDALAGAVDFFSQVPSDVAYTPQPVTLRVQRVIGNYDRWSFHGRLKIQQISHGRDGADDTMTLLYTPDIQYVTTEHFPDVIELLAPDRAVQAYVQTGKRSRRLLFQGYPQPKSIQWSPQGQGMSITCLSQGQERIRHGKRQQIVGRHMRSKPEPLDPEELGWTRTSPDDVEIPALPTIFNAGGRPNRTAKLYPFVGSAGVDADSVWLYLFTENDAPGAEYWNYCDALRYIVYHYCDRDDAGRPIDVSDFLTDTKLEELYIGGAHLPDSMDPFTRDITRRCDDNVSLQSTNLDEALSILCGRAGLHYRIDLASTEVGRGGFDAEYRLNVSGHLINADTEVDEQRHMRQPQRRDIPRAAPWTDFSANTPREIAEATAADTAQITIDDRRINRAIFLGGYREYETTCLLRPGWEPVTGLDNVTQTTAAIKTAVDAWIAQFITEYDPLKSFGTRTPRSIYHAEHPNHAPVADVFRLWIFPDSDEYDAEALARTVGKSADVDPVWDQDAYTYNGNGGKNWWENPLYGAAISPQFCEDWIPRRRPFRDTIGRANLMTTVQSPIVRIHFGNGDGVPPTKADTGWRDVTSFVEFDTQRAAIRFTEANPFDSPPFKQNPDNGSSEGNTAIEAYINLDFWVSVTATVRGDERMRYDASLPSDIGIERSQVIDLGFERFQSRRQLPGSHLTAIVETDGAYKARLDDEAFEGYCARLFADMQQPTIAGRAGLFFMCDDYRPGDSITGVDGLQIHFDRYPIIDRVVWVNARGNVRTDLILTDLRAAPEATP